MKVQSNGKIRRTSLEWEAIFAEFEASGLSAAAFCRRKKIAKSTFTKRRRAPKRKPALRQRRRPARFVELTAPPDASPARAFEIELPGGVVLRWKA